MKKFRLISLLLAIVFSIILTGGNYASAKVLKENTPYESISEDTKISIQNYGINCKISVYVNDILDHEVLLNRDTGEMTLNDFKARNVQFLNVNDYLTDVQPYYEGEPTDGYYFIASGTSYLDPNIMGLLYGKDRISENVGKRINFSSGTKVGAVSGVIISCLGLFVPGSGVISTIILALGSAIVGGVLGSYIDGTVRLKQYVTDLKVKVKGTVPFTTYRSTGYAKTYNALTDRVEEVYVGTAGNWNDNATLIHQGVSAYLN